jgi:hypothetical protein
MKFAVVHIPTRLAKEFADLEINPIVMGYFPSKAMEALGWDKSTGSNYDRGERRLSYQRRKSRAA